MTVRPALLGAFAASLGGHLALAMLPDPWDSAPVPPAAGVPTILLSGGAAQSTLVERWTQAPDTPDEPPRSARNPTVNEAVRQVSARVIRTTPPERSMAPAAPDAPAWLPEHPEIPPAPTASATMVPDATLAAIRQAAARKMPNANFAAIPPAPEAAPSAPVALARRPEHPEILPAPAAPAVPGTADTGHPPSPGQVDPGMRRLPRSTRRDRVPLPSPAGPAPAQGTQSGRNGLLLQRYASGIRTELLRRRHYPEAAQDAGLRGEVVLELTLSRDGALQHAAVLRSSGSALLDHAAQETARRGRFGPAPDGLPGTEFRFRVPLVFRIP